MLLEAGTKAPDFNLPDQDGKTHTLRFHRGGWVLVYFYPQDDTSGCTKEACVFRDRYAQFERARVHVFGVSPDSVESHKKFADKYTLPFTLLSDPARITISAYGAADAASTKRISYLIGHDGIIVKTYPDVDPATHGGEILKDVYLLGKSTSDGERRAF